MAGLSLILSKYEIWFSKFVGGDEAKCHTNVNNTGLCQLTNGLCIY